MATPTKVEICNMALALCGVRVGFVENFSTDETAEAALCRTFYESSKKETLIEHPWPFALSIVNFTSANRTTSPLAPWSYKYAVSTAASTKSDGSNLMLDFIEFVDGTMVRHLYRKIDYVKRGNDAIHTDFGPASLGTGDNTVSVVILNNHDDTDTPGFDPHFSWALAVNLASKLCSPLGAPQLRPALLDLFKRALGEAIRHSGNSQEAILPPPDSEMVTERQG